MNNKHLSDKMKFSLIRRAESFTHAGRGVVVFLQSTHNAWVHGLLCIFAIALGIYFGITRMEWVAIFLAAALVFVAEAFNTAIEFDIDLTSPEYHPYARDTKDVAAGAVLIAAGFALLVGLFVFAPYL